jgi:tetratricopeptide (TPR) repeat protein
MLTTHHPTEETLAAYVDVRLDSAARSEVTEHLVTCGECREIVLMATEYQTTEVSNVRQGTFGQPWLAAAALAVAASIAVVVIQPVWLFGRDVDDLIAASQGLSKRPSDGRLAAGFAYSEKPVRMRGPGQETDDHAMAKVWSIAADLDESSDPHLRGLTMLFVAKDITDLNAAVVDLEKAYAEARAKDRDSVANDLAAALLARARFRNDSGDHLRALKLADDVLLHQQSLEALWNRAVALESLNTAKAIEAWDDYLKVDPNSEWALEAKSRKADL